MRRQSSGQRFSLSLPAKFTVLRRGAEKIGGESGHEPGQFGYISDAVQDADRFLLRRGIGEK